MTFPLLPICRAAKKEIRENRAKKCRDLVYVQASLETIEDLLTIDEYYPDGKTLEIAFCYHWNTVRTRKPVIDHTCFLNDHQFGYFKTILQVCLGTPERTEHILETIPPYYVRQSERIAKLNLSKIPNQHPFYFVIYFPKVMSGVVDLTSFPILWNAVPEGKFFLKSVPFPDI